MDKVRLDELYWTERYKTERTGWDLGIPSPPLMHLMEGFPDRNARILIPGAGNAHDWVALCEHGYEHCYALDISLDPLNKLKGVHPQWADRLIHADFFDLNGSWDIILEQTFFCALDPDLRPEYARVMHRLLSPGGKLCGVLFDRRFDGGPPFGGDPEEYHRYFAPYFKFHTWEACHHSHPARQGSEWWMVLEKRDHHE